MFALVASLSKESSSGFKVEMCDQLSFQIIAASRCVVAGGLPLTCMFIGILDLVFLVFRRS